MSIEHLPPEFEVVEADGAAGGMIDCIVFMPIGRSYNFTTEQKEELRAMSFGISINEHSQHENTPPSTSLGRRAQILKKTFSSTSAEAIVKGFLTGELEYTLDSERRHPELSLVQLQMLGFIATGYTNKEIAKNQWVTAAAINIRVGKILRELNAKNRYHAMRRSFETGLFRTTYPALEQALTHRPDLAKELGYYAGRWVAIRHGKVTAFGDNPTEFALFRGYEQGDECLRVPNIPQDSSPASLQHRISKP